MVVKKMSDYQMKKEKIVFWCLRWHTLINLGGRLFTDLPKGGSCHVGSLTHCTKMLMGHEHPIYGMAKTLKVQLA